MRTLTFITLLSWIGCTGQTVSATRTEPSGSTHPPAMPAAHSAPSDDDFGNAMPASSMTGMAGSAAPQPAATATPACSPGLYLGTYDCEVDVLGFPFPLAGDVSFNLSVNETTMEEDCGEEFCADLVISENSGTLFGFAGAIAFETKLQGALDCKTGEFKAQGVDGKYGNGISTDPNDPDALWTVEDPPIGMFEGMLVGMHRAGTPEFIDGNWDLGDVATGSSCHGPFKVVLQPAKP